MTRSARRICSRIFHRRCATRIRGAAPVELLRNSGRNRCQSSPNDRWRGGICIKFREYAGRDRRQGRFGRHFERRICSYSIRARKARSVVVRPPGGKEGHAFRSRKRAAGQQPGAGSGSSWLSHPPGHRRSSRIGLDRPGGNDPVEPGYGLTVIPVQYVSGTTLVKLMEGFASKPGRDPNGSRRQDLARLGNRLRASDGSRHGS